MPAASQVVPKRWTNTHVLFDNGWYSLIQGEYLNDDGTSHPNAMGERWNGGRGLGFPNTSGYPVWHVVPAFLELPILRGLLEELANNPDEQVRERGVAAGEEAAEARTQRVTAAIEDRE